MNITVKLFASFREGRFKIEERKYADGITPGEIISSVGIDPDDVGVIMVNSRHAAPDFCLTHNDILAIFPVIGGG